MADEPERRIVGAILVELEQQPYFNLHDEVDWKGQVGCDGQLDLLSLARAVLAEVQSGG